MKALFRCEYCDKIGVAEEIEKHENECIHNRTKRSCFTCKHANKHGFAALKFACAHGKQIEEDHYYCDCDSYEWDERDHTTRNPIASNNLFGGAFF